MKSVGEVMAVGRTFKEAFLKGMRSLELGASGRVFTAGDADDEALNEDDGELQRRLVTPTDTRIWSVFRAFERGWSVDHVHEATRIDRWFLTQFRELVELKRAAALVDVREMSDDLMRALKRAGFGDDELGHVLGVSPDLISQGRTDRGLVAVYKRIDTCAAEFESFTPYLYSTYEKECESDPTDRPKVVILGSGPNRIGQGIEFDYCCCHAAFALRSEGFETVMINCNPETVSDRL